MSSRLTHAAASFAAGGGEIHSAAITYRRGGRVQVTRLLARFFFIVPLKSIHTGHAGSSQVSSQKPSPGTKVGVGRFTPPLALGSNDSVLRQPWSRQLQVKRDAGAAEIVGLEGVVGEDEHAVAACVNKGVSTGRDVEYGGDSVDSIGTRRMLVNSMVHRL